MDTTLDLSALIDSLTFLAPEEKAFFLAKIPTLTEEGEAQVRAFLQQAIVEYEKEEKRIDEKYSEELQKINHEVDRDFLAAKKMIEGSLREEEQTEENMLLNQL